MPPTGRKWKVPSQDQPNGEMHCAGRVGRVVGFDGVTTLVTVFSVVDWPVFKLTGSPHPGFLMGHKGHFSLLRLRFPFLSFPLDSFS